MPTGSPNEFVEIYGWPSEASYYAAEPERPSDFTTLHMDFIAQRALLPGLAHKFSAFQDDLYNLSASLAKLDLIHRSSLEGKGRMAATEVEHILQVCRSMFDLLQEMLACLWESIRKANPQLKARALKSSFADMALKGDDARSAEELAATFGLFDEVAACYARHAPVFLHIRKFRDDLVHRGRRVGTIFVGDDGFLIPREFGPFKDLRIWRDAEMLPNELGPLNAALGLIIHNTLWACNDFIIALCSHVEYPPPLVPNMQLYCRGDFNTELLAAVRDAQDRITDGRGLITPRPNAPPIDGDVEN
ncbi:hypothetical protein FM111_11210 [Brevundimonas diminuta 3F5N]|uniref:Uncharacterized protein n=1 Tax=Brevundimonas diminuta 3F5N TaxID=1255603 RepID=A0A1R4GB60_BREDI|nr:hypothetical protein FM111_11210 [Brevundimonas diminuta 3F5N]